MVVSVLQSLVKGTSGCLLWPSICTAHFYALLESFESQVCLLDIKLTGTTLHSTQKESRIKSSFQNYQGQNILPKPQSTMKGFLLYHHVQSWSFILQHSYSYPYYSAVRKRRLTAISPATHAQNKAMNERSCGTVPNCVGRNAAI